MNAGAGCIGAAFVHERFTEAGASEMFPMLKGWWGNTMKTKFLMRDGWLTAATKRCPLIYYLSRS